MFDTIIIGGGPAGMTAALYLLRENKKVLIIEKESFGGQIATSPRLENYPSIKSISGLEFSSNLFDQISDAGVEFELDDVKKVSKVGDKFIVTTEYKTFESKTVIVAAGAKHKHMNLPQEEELIGKGVSYCATCDGPFYKGEDVVLIGDANSAVIYAFELSEYCHSVKICTLFDHFFAEKYMVDKLLTLPNISVRHNLNLTKFDLDENGKFKGLIFEDTKTKEIVNEPCSGVFIAIGQEPQNGFIDPSLVDLNKGYIKVDSRMQTKTEGLFAIGDCIDKEVRQVITATSDGAIAAISVSRYLSLFK